MTPRAAGTPRAAALLSIGAFFSSNCGFERSKAHKDNDVDGENHSHSATLHFCSLDEVLVRMTIEVNSGFDCGK